MGHHRHTARVSSAIAATLILIAVAVVYPVDASAEPTSVHVHRMRYGLTVTEPQRLDVTVTIRDNANTRIDGDLFIGFERFGTRERMLASLSGHQQGT